MHACTAVAIDQLLSLRDEEPTAADVARHVEHCAACAHELARLRNLQTALRGLPLLPTPAYDGIALRAKLFQPRASLFSSWRGIAVAASFSVIAISLLFATTNTRLSNSQTGVAELPVAAVPSQSSDPPIAALVVRSQELESRLQRLPRRPHVERASTTTTIGDLQSRIQWVDYQLSLADDVGLTERQSVLLWQDRIRLMDTLVKVRFAEAQRVAVLQ